MLTIRFLFFFNDTAPSAIYTLSLHDALPILLLSMRVAPAMLDRSCGRGLPRLHSSTSRTHSLRARSSREDRKSTRLNSSHVRISYAVFCLKKNTLHNN